MLLVIKNLWHLGLPLCLTYIVQMLMILVDSAFVGKIGYDALAAVSLGSNLFEILLLLLIGVCVASSIKAAQALGSGDQRAMQNCLRQGTLLAGALGLLMVFVLLNASPAMLALGQNTIVVEASMSYLSWLAWALPIQALIILYRNYFAVIGQPWAGLWPAFFALLLNAFLDYCLSTGELGFPAMGITGIGLASFLSSVTMLLLMMKRLGWSTVKVFFQFLHPDVWLNKGVLRLFVISLPISIATLAEGAFFAGSALLAGSIGVAEQAAHQIVLNSIETSYMFNLGIATACGIQIGKLVGERNFKQILPTVKGAWFIVIIITLPFAIFLGMFDDFWIRIFLDSAEVDNHASILFVKSVIVLALIMLFLDAIWLIVIESLHGMLDTVFPAIATLFAYWMLGGPLVLWAINHYAEPFTWIWIVMLLVSILLTLLVSFRLFIKLKFKNI